MLRHIIRNKRNLVILKIDNSNLSDKKILNLCSTGAELGYSLFYQRYSKSVYNTIVRLVTETSEAEDLTQDIFVSIFTDIQKIMNIDNLGAWIKRVAINKSISHLRKKKIYFSDVENENIIDKSEDELNEKQDWDGKVEEILSAIESLPTETKTIVNLFLFENISHEEIAKMLGVNNTTVRSKYHRAKKKISELIQQTACHE